MSHMHTLMHKAATDPTFSAALLADPREAAAQWNLEVSAEELTVLSGMAHVLALPSQDLLAQLLGSAIGPEQQWQSLSSTGRYAVSKTG